MDIFERELAGEVIDPQTDPEFDKFLAVQRQSYELTHKLNTLPYLGDEMKPMHNRRQCSDCAKSQSCYAESRS